LQDRGASPQLHESADNEFIYIRYQRLFLWQFRKTVDSVVQLCHISGTLVEQISSVFAIFSYILAN